MEQIKKLWADFTGTSDSTSLYDKTDIENNKVMAILAYLWILFLIPIFLAKGSKFAKYHANQGLVLFVCVTVVSVAAGILTGILPILGIVFWVVDLFFILLMVVGILNAVNGKARILPVIGGIKILNV